MDYALLSKVRSEIEFKRDQETLELVESELAKNENLDESEDEEEDWSIKSKLAQNLMNVLFENNLPEKNDYFLPGRLAYVFDLENDCPSDAFTTLLRSKADCPNWEQMNALSTNDIVLNKLIDIFQELREEGGRRKKKVTKQSDKLEDNKKFSFINSALDKSESASSRGGRESQKSKSDTIETADLNNIYDQELNVESIRKTKPKVENDLDIYDDLDDYVMPHKLDNDRDRRGRRSRSREDDYYKDRHSSSKYSSNRDRNYDKKRKRRSSSRERYDRNYSSEEEKRDNYHSSKDWRKDHERTRTRTPDKYRYHSSSNYSSSSRRERY